MTTQSPIDPARVDPARIDHAGPAWAPDEIAVVRAQLTNDAARLRLEISLAGREMSQAAAEATMQVLHDEVDIASSRLDLLQDAVQTENAAAILAQIEHVIDRLDRGLYGRCENCEGEIARARLEAFPRATLCLACAVH